MKKTGSTCVGSSPRARRTLVLAHVDKCRVRFIPACAENTFHIDAAVCPQAVQIARSSYGGAGVLKSRQDSERSPCLRHSSGSVRVQKPTSVSAKPRSASPPKSGRHGAFGRGQLGHYDQVYSISDQNQPRTKTPRPNGAAFRPVARPAHRIGGVHARERAGAFLRAGIMDRPMRDFVRKNLVAS